MKKPEQYYRETAEELKLDLSDVRQANAFFWKVGVKEPLKKIEHTAIFIKNIGTILVSRNKLYKEIEKIIRKIRAVENSVKFKPESKIDIIANYKARLKDLLRKRNELIKEGIYDR
jgi:vacuolar-type H+-ATPase subunit I/STV1